MIDFLNKHGFVIFVGFFALMYAFGVLSPSHYAMGSFATYISYFVTLFITLGLGAFFVGRPVKIASLSLGVWVAVFLWFILQPVLHEIPYVDALIFPITGVLVAGLVTLSVVNMTHTEQRFLMDKLAWTLLIVALLLIVTQFCQLFGTFPKTWIMPASARLSGNIAQPNQAGFVMTMAILAVTYLFNQRLTQQWMSHIVWIGAGISIFILATGIGLTVSRGAVLLVVASVILSGFFPWQSAKLRIGYLLLLMIGLSTGYILGTYLINHYSPFGLNDTSAVDRLIHDDTLQIRYNLLVQAWLAFHENWLLGLGYGGFGWFGVTHADKLAQLTTAVHAHNIFAQVAAEFGIIGLIFLGVFIYIILTKLKGFLLNRLSNSQWLAFSSLVIIGLYSLSEFPLWYMRFLFLAAVLIAILDDKYTYEVRLFSARPIVILLTMLVAIGSLFYIQKYNHYLRSYEIIVMSSADMDTKIKSYENLSNVFGYQKFKEYLLFSLLHVEVQKATQQRLLGERVLKARPFDEYLLQKQGLLLILDKQPQAAKKLYMAACLQERTISHSNKCPKTIQTIKVTNPPNADEYVSSVELFVQK